ncbi:ERMES complex subunit mmm1 [Venturia effusa]|uniref:Maintenance of mitochondrial morphology protein 1 n=1 Tax=Venturia effusa TaxID=50376 RepID=A0A517L2I5_9PEZI|nr:ERMES complex subunit mmm1 [Venturia effusa]
MNALLAFFLGQLTLALLIFAFIKFFIFGDPPPPSHLTRPRTPSSSSRLTRKKSSLLRTQVPTTTANILAKTYYNVKGHQPESLDWFNVLVAQTIAQLRADAHHDEAILRSLNDVMNGGQRPDFLGHVRVTEINLGEEYPIFSNCRVIPVEEEDGLGGPRLQARLDVDLADCITLGVETKLVLNYPKRLVAVLPVALAVSVVRFSGTLSLSFIPAAHSSSGCDTEDQSSSPTTLSFSFLPDYRLDLSVRSLVGSRARLQDVPKIAQVVEARIHQWFDERCVEPRVQQIVLPSLWPRKKNTRGSEDPPSDEEEEDEERDDTTLADTPVAKMRADTPVDGSLEARMAEEGKKLREADGRAPIDETPTKNPEGLRRRPLHRAMNSMQGIRLPGGYS